MKSNPIPLYIHILIEQRQYIKKLKNKIYILNEELNDAKYAESIFNDIHYKQQKILKKEIIKKINLKKELHQKQIMINGLIKEQYNNKSETANQKNENKLNTNNSINLYNTNRQSNADQNNSKQSSSKKRFMHQYILMKHHQFKKNELRIISK